MLLFNKRYGTTIQWGNKANAGASDTTVTLSKSYNNASYKVVFGVYDANNTNAYCPIVKSRTVSSFVYALNSNYDGAFWLSIGY